MSRKTDPARARNFASVLQEIFAAPGRSRKDIADAIGISVASVTSIAASLLEHRLISESAPVAAGQGRPRVPLSVDTDSNLVMGIHLGRESRVSC
ncbi:MarR family transcriptional regulator [Glutamicibacter protophormiae]|uniref:MarR family transcriptional regulator n=1 Tax=Glutamicibacter protophormiae TaxID=37930 RepID=UPI00332F2FA9